MDIIICDSDVVFAKEIAKHIEVVRGNLSKEDHIYLNNNSVNFRDRHFDFLIINIEHSGDIANILEIYDSNKFILYSQSISLIYQAWNQGIFTIIPRNQFFSIFNNLFSAYLKNFYLSSFFVKGINKTYRLRYCQIYQIISNGNYVFIYTEREIIKVRGSFRNFRFDNDLDNFLCVDKAKIVNMDKVIKFDVYHQTILLINNLEINTSLRGIRLIEKYFKN